MLVGQIIKAQLIIYLYQFFMALYALLSAFKARFNDFKAISI